MDQAGARALSFEFASKSDDVEIRKLLRETAMPGRVSVTMRREPDFFIGAGVEGDQNHTIVIRERASNQLVAIGSRSERDAFINGEVRRLGYLGHVRVRKGFRGGKGVLRGGYALLEKVQHASQAPLCITTIIEDNRHARKALASGMPGIPSYWEFTKLSSLAIPVWRRRWEPRIPGIQFRWARPDDLVDIADCLQRNFKNHQFAPYITADDLADARYSAGLHAKDFLLAVTRQGRVLGCVALWDQQAFKQLVVESYGGPLKRIRPIVNLFGPMLGVPYLPRPGLFFRFVHLSHMAAPIDDQPLWMALMARACNAAQKRNFKYVSVGLTELHPVLAHIKRAYRHIDYRAVLYTVHWGEDASAVKSLDNRIPHVEIAML